MNSGPSPEIQEADLYLLPVETASVNAAVSPEQKR